MTSLPQNPLTDSQVVMPISGTSVGKEIEPPTVVSELAPDVEQNKDTELPKEVSAIGVRQQPTTVVLPIIVAQAGVQAINPAGPPIRITPTIVLPLSDDQIAKGLQESVVSSVRWLAQWCERRLKQVMQYARPNI